jgi:hypothetical protein
LSNARPRTSCLLGSMKFSILVQLLLLPSPFLPPPKSLGARAAAFGSLTCAANAEFEQSTHAGQPFPPTNDLPPSGGN